MSPQRVLPISPTRAFPMSPHRVMHMSPPRPMPMSPPRMMAMSPPRSIAISPVRPHLINSLVTSMHLPGSNVNANINLIVKKVFTSLSPHRAHLAPVSVAARPFGSVF